MKASEAQITKFLANNNTAFAIPVYQRDYEWKEAQCKQLLDDILTVGENNDTHFIGSIVYIQDAVGNKSTLDELTVIDGQQRLTTMTLIYIALYQIAKQQSKIVAEQIHEQYLINKFESNDEEKLKLKPTDNHKKALKHIMNSPNEAFESYSRIVENFNYFKKHIHQDNFETIQKGLSKLLFIDVALERGKDDPQRIFESLNSTGLKLEQADLIRNYILMKLDHKEQKRVYETYWQKIETLACDETLNKKKVSEFIRDYLTLKMGKIPTIANVYATFKKKQEDSSETLEAILEDLTLLAKFYNKLINPAKENDADIRLQLQYMKRLEAHVTFPFIMQVYADFDANHIDKNTFLSVLSTIESFIFRRFICSIPTNGLNKIFMNLYKKINHETYLVSIQNALLLGLNTQQFPRDSDVINAFKTKNIYILDDNKRLHLLERLEHFNNKERIVIENNPEISVEHIFPQTPDNEWRQLLNTVEIQDIQTNLLHTIGNLTLSGNNGALGNKSFLKKQAMNVDGKEQGYKYSRLWLNSDLTNKTTWGKADIEERTNHLSQRFLKIWPLPNVEKKIRKSKILFEEVNIFDAENPKSKKLEYAILFGNKLVPITVTDLYQKVFSTLIDLHPTALLASGVSKKLKLSQESTDLRSPKSISSFYFIETNIDSTTKFETIKEALTLMDYTEELFIKYAEEV